MIDQKAVQTMDAQRDGAHWFQYGPEAVAYLKQKDKILGALIDQIGPVRREVDPDLFSAVVHHIVGQQISTKAQATIWGRMREALVPLDAASVLAAGVPWLQSFGLTFRKADYITDFAAKVQSGAFDLEQIRHSSDQEAVEALCGLKGVGVWTAEMILLFCLQRPDVLSYDDLAIQRGLRMVYRHRSIDRARFERYRRRWSPYGSTASLYLWAAAGGAVPGLTDPALRAKRSMPKKGKKEGLS
ncbi:DNA-3-methyladenine glycosylase [Pseudoflavonifractor sp. MSJ-37]|uniref:DNA-3-methyladenine glycosylase family protein n=1 Tax=Pseudoflavonifractor sp. MSJ-37 TaxID=2841531 RepID=UPI00209F6139|nr:DNA-3-methyladenine glycosylase 2 family protein [Pseudoflavonifractor sp. MSJ-37]